MKKEVYNKIQEKIQKLETLLNGGKGSGNFGHSGRPGEIGGSGDGGSIESVDEKTKVLVDVPDEYGDKVKEYIGSSEYKAKYEKLQEARSKEKTAESVMAEAGKKLAEMKSKLKSSPDGKMSAKALDEYSACKKEKLAKTSDFNKAKAERKSAEREIADGFRGAVLKGEKGLEIEASVGKIGGSKDLLITLRKRNGSEDTAKTLNGGKGSGNFGHSGRPGEVGGSGGGYAGIGSSKADKIEKMIDRKVEARKKIAETKALHGTGEMSGEEAAEKIADLKAKEKKGSEEISLRGKSLYEKVHMIEPGDEVHIKPQDNLPNFDKKIKVDYIQDGTIHYGSSETSDGYTYPAWAIKDITKIVRKKKNSIYAEVSKRLAEIEKMINGGKGSGNFGHSGRPGEVGGSAGAGGGMTMPERASDPHDWFQTVREVQKEYKERQEEIDKNADRVVEKIFDTGEAYVGPKKTVLDFIKQNIKYHADDSSDEEEFLEIASEWLDDYKMVKESKAKKFRVSENPMSGTNVVIDEVKDKK